MEETPSKPAPLLFRVAFGLFAASIGLAVAGTLLLRLVPASAPFFAPYMDVLVNAPTWAYMALLPVLSFTLYVDSLRIRKSLLFVVIGACIGATAELIGTQTGFPFGEYAYTARLGLKIAGHVPYFIPLSWYALSIICYDLSGRLDFGRTGRIVGTAILMILWDVSLDPAMNQGGGTFVFWSYPSGGAYFGMPWINWFGWFVTSAIIGVGYELTGGFRTRRSPAVYRWAPILYALNILFPVSICFLYGLPMAGAIGLIALIIPLLALRIRSIGSTTRRFTV
ncbi:MAG: bisanhydrobacterioruberin hydratase CruF [Rubricoccaceae bacterium]|nr:bisanhydrobacterioruberin hydratase CruF [Rubricoccaceae bacterium]